MKLLKMLIVPLILASMIVGVAKVGDIRKLGGLGGRTFVFYITTTFASVLVGLILVNLIKPGSGAPALGGVVPEAAYSTVSVWSVVLNMIPDNPFKAMVNMEILPLIVFALFMGGVLTTIGQKGKPLIDFFDSLNDVMMKMADVVIKLTPIGVFALLGQVVAQIFMGPFLSVNLTFIVVWLIEIWKIPVKGHIIAWAIGRHWYFGIMIAMTIFIMQYAAYRAFIEPASN